MAFDFQSLEDSSIRLIDGDRGKNYPKQTDFYMQGYCLFLSAKNVTSDGFKFDETVFITQKKDELLRSGKVLQGDIIMTTRGTIGNVAFYERSVPFDHIRINSGMMIFRADEKIWNPRFLYFVLTSPIITQQINALTSGSAVPQLPARDLKKFQLPNVPKAIQDCIAELIGSVVNKIKINQQTSQTLEQMAQALFKSWFVDFDPVIDNALSAGNAIPDALQHRVELRKRIITERATNPKLKPLPVDIQHRFPSEFEQNEILGWIPKGWENGTLANIANALSGYAFKGKDFSEDGCAVIKIKNISADRKVGIYDVNRVPPEKTASASRFLLNDGDIVMAMTGAGSVGRFGVMASESNEPYYLNQRVCKISPKLKNGSPFLFAALNKPGVEEDIFKAAQGSGQPNISANGILATKLLVPSVNSIELFNTLLMETFERKITLRKESYTLTKLRNTLLPKLIAGEIKIPDVKIADVKTA
jgi:type I restriction enzyme S subunit